MSTTKPTIGRIVWYWPAASDRIKRVDPVQPLAAIIAYVWNDSSVNLTVFDAQGNAQGRTSVTFVQAHDTRPKGHFAEWPLAGGVDRATRICPTPKAVCPQCGHETPGASRAKRASGAGDLGFLD